MKSSLFPRVTPADADQKHTLEGTLSFWFVATSWYFKLGVMEMLLLLSGRAGKRSVCANASGQVAVIAFKSKMNLKATHNQQIIAKSAAR